MKHSRRIRDIRPFHVMKVLARAMALEREGRDVIHLEVGEPDFATPAPIVEAGQRALAEGRTKYTEATGIAELRELIAQHYAAAYRPSPARVAVTPGSSGALQIALALLLNPGDEVLMADPGYPCNANFVRLFDGVPVMLACDAANDYQITSDQLRHAWTEQSRILLLASPSNPTGAVIDIERIRDLAGRVRDLGGTVIVDEIYHGLVYGDEQDSALAAGDDIFVVNSFSKFYGMTGWRLGWLVTPDDYCDAVERLCQNLFISAPTPAQYAALAAFTTEVRDELLARRDEFRARRDLLLPGLRELGFGIPTDPQGAFYIYADASRFTEDSENFCDELLIEEGVAITPGLDFGRYQAQQHVRFCYANSRERLSEALERLARFVGG